MVDKLAALGMVSVFDIEEVGADVLASDLGVTPEQAATAVDLASAKAKIVAEQQQKEKEEAERRRQEELAAAQRLLSGEEPAPADAVASATDASSEPSPGAEQRAADILGGS
jgi:N utilization substance protein A